MNFAHFSKSALTKIHYAIIALIIIMVAILGVYYLSLPASNSSKTTPSPSPTPTQTSTPTPAPIRNIETSYTTSKKQYVVWYGVSGYSYEDYPDAGKVYLEVNMTISNNGYESFGTNPYYFYVVADSIKYTYDGVTYTVNNRDTVDILDGGIYSGTLMFQIPTSASSVIIGYERSFATYYITWTEI